jgi:hypothetical protein
MIFFNYEVGRWEMGVGKLGDGSIKYEAGSWKQEFRLENKKRGFNFLFFVTIQPNQNFTRIARIHTNSRLNNLL